MNKRKQPRRRGRADDFIVSPTAETLRTMERKTIDDGFLSMRTDRGYQSEALRITEEFGSADAEVALINPAWSDE